MRKTLTHDDDVLHVWIRDFFLVFNRTLVSQSKETISGTFKRFNYRVFIF
jgi:hypothetical protein